MKLLSGMFAAALLLWGIGVSQAAVRIANDAGGRIDRYLDGYEKLGASGQMVMIDGLCASACTIVLAVIPRAKTRAKICVTSNANLGFHAAWDFGAHRRAITNPEVTRILFAMYPVAVRRWIAHHGGLTPRSIFLRGKQLQAMYRSC